MPHSPVPGALIPLDGAMNLRDLGGWPTDDGSTTAYGRLFRCDRLSDLSDADHRTLEALGIDTVVDLRYNSETTSHPSRLWPGVLFHHAVPMGGRLAQERSFIERALAGELDDLTEHDVGESYIEFLTDHRLDFGRAIDHLLGDNPSLFHCSAGKDRTGLVSMLMLRTVGVGPDEVMADYLLSNEYRAERRMAELEPVFAEHGRNVDDFRPALSAPQAAMERALEWIDQTHGGAEAYLAGPAGMVDPGPRLHRRLLGSSD